MLQEVQLYSPLYLSRFSIIIISIIIPTEMVFIAISFCNVYQTCNKNTMYEKCGSILHSRAIIEEKLRLIRPGFTNEERQIAKDCCFVSPCGTR